ncbi:MAG: caspase family protein, partial [Methylococcales bacterium]
GEEQGIQTALQAIGDVRQVLAGGLPPSLELLSAPNVAQTDGDYTVQFKLFDQGGGIGNIVYQVDGNVLDGRPVGIGIPGRDPLSRSFKLAPGEHSIEILSYDAKNQIASRAIKTVVQINQPSLPITLHVLALGISNYRDHALQLKYADTDALAMSIELAQRGQGLFDKVAVSSPLLNEQVTLANIDAAFTDLAGKVQPQDVFVLYLAGHGKTLNGDYHFVPWDMVVKNADSLREHSLDQNKLAALLKKIPATKTVVLLDTCDSGSFTMAARDTGQLTRGIEQKTGMARLMRATGRAVIAATSDDNMALEGYGNPGDKHGVFTYALLEGLKKSDTNGNSQIEVNELADFVETRVPEVTKQAWGYEQFPMRETQGMNFPIGMRP